MSAQFERVAHFVPRLAQQQKRPQHINLIRGPGGWWTVSHEVTFATEEEARAHIEEITGGTTFPSGPWVNRT